MTPLFISVLLAAMCLGMNTTLAQKDNVLQAKGEETAAAGGTVTLGCLYNTSIQAQNLQWYRQDPGSAPQFLLLITDTSEPSVLRATPPNPRLTAALDKERNRVNLEISSAAVSDSAVYYCALQPTVTGNSKTLYKNLWSKQNTPQHPLEGATHC
uniref:Ig-like domain-containing protein n=1 Tax=Astatotilapia calliptera TaxID=8154 RepID=A0A3P8QDL2_ASTCA